MDLKQGVAERCKPHWNLNTKHNAPNADSLTFSVHELMPFYTECPYACEIGAITKKRCSEASKTLGLPKRSSIQMGDKFWHPFGKTEGTEYTLVGLVWKSYRLFTTSTRLFGLSSACRSSWFGFHLSQPSVPFPSISRDPSISFSLAGVEVASNLLVHLRSDSWLDRKCLI